MNVDNLLGRFHQLINIFTIHLDHLILHF